MVVAVGVSMVALAACGSSGSAGSTATTLAEVAGQAPGLVGTWVGDYTYPLRGADGSPQPIKATERLVIEHQDGELLWGYDEYVDAGQMIRIPVRGYVGADGEVTLAEEGGAFRGRVRPDGSLALHFARTDDQFTAFAVRLTRT